MRTAVKKQIFKMPTVLSTKRWPVSSRYLIQKVLKKKAINDLKKFYENTAKNL